MRPLSLRAHLMIGAVFLMVGLFGGSIILWHITLGNREPPSIFFALLSHAHLFGIVCLWSVRGESCGCTRRAMSTGCW